MQSPRGSAEHSSDKGDAPILFFKSFLARPKEVGSVIPSSRFMERRIVRCANIPNARVVVELGPGTGGTTRALLRSLPANSTLLAIEINPRLAARVRERIHDPRLIVHCGCATELTDALDEHDLPAADVVVSGIPFSTMPPSVGRDVVQSVRSALAAGGLFVAYQVRDRVAELGTEAFGPPRVEREVRNVPPMRVYRFEKAQAS